MTTFLAGVFVGAVGTGLGLTIYLWLAWDINELEK